ncbi:MAG: universal stress protein [Thermodesulfobacteriota bacterium]
MYKKIMVPLDGSKLAECVLPHVEAFINGFNISDVFLIRVKEPVKPDVRIYDNTFNEEFIRQAQKIWSDVEQQGKAEARDYLNKIAERLKQKKTAMHPEVLIGDVAKKLSDYAESEDIDLIIMATHGYSGIKRWIMGSVAEKLFRSARMPVFMVRAAEIKGGMQQH